MLLKYGLGYEMEYHMIGVVGGGTMGAGIATSCAVAGENVVLVEADETRAEAALGSVRDSVSRLARKNETIDVDTVLARVIVATELAATDGCQMVIEAVPEDLEMKRTLFGELDRMHDAGVVLASNTSSLSIGSIAEGLAHRGRVIGAHFFNPVPVSALVEIVVGPETAESTTAAATALATTLDKTPIVVKDSPGFASSRLGLVLGLEAIRMLESGVASAADIDTAMELGYRHPMGPLRLTDLIGLDVRLAIAQHLERELGERFAPPALLIEKVAAGQLGKKSGVGFYQWGQAP